MNSTLTQLQVSHCGLGQMEAEPLGQALKQNSTLVQLDLSGNYMDDQAVALLCQGLNTNCTLSVLKVTLHTFYRLNNLKRSKTCTNGSAVL